MATSKRYDHMKNESDLENNCNVLEQYTGRQSRFSVISEKSFMKFCIKCLGLKRKQKKIMIPFIAELKYCNCF